PSLAASGLGGLEGLSPVVLGGRNRVGCGLPNTCSHGARSVTALALPLQSTPPPYEVVQSDCLSYLGQLQDASVDIITTDPAYSGMNQHMMFGHGRIVGRYEEAGTD